MASKKKTAGRPKLGADAKNITVTVKMSKNEMKNHAKRGVTLRSLIDEDKQRHSIGE